MFQRGDLAEPANRQFNRRDEIADGEGFDQVGHRPRITSAFNQITLTEGGQHDDRRDAFTGDLRRSVNPVATRHLDIHDHKIGLMTLGQFHGFLAIAGFPDDLVPLLSQHFGEVHPDERFVFSDENPARLSGIGVAGGTRHDGHCVVGVSNWEPWGAVSRDRAPLR
uniref:Uncharacterized protein n=1 Tax=Mycobacterium riyadhense TaxID=486698 RepID=A0A653EQJ4_9MYCO|nr:hypothetical protein BIN_B_03110 [Mycobacterium riyadhense]